MTHPDICEREKFYTWMEVSLLNSKTRSDVSLEGVHVVRRWLYFFL